MIFVRLLCWIEMKYMNLTINQMINNRLWKIVRKANPPINAGGYHGLFLGSIRKI
jgi:hypothetical protein